MFLLFKHYRIIVVLCVVCILHEVCVLRTCIANYKGMQSKSKSKKQNNHHRGPIKQSITLAHNRSVVLTLISYRGQMILMKPM